MLCEVENRQLGLDKAFDCSSKDKRIDFVDTGLRFNSDLKKRRWKKFSSMNE